jgi:hypothetical protein
LVPERFVPVSLNLEIYPHVVFGTYKISAHLFIYGSFITGFLGSIHKVHQQDLKSSLLGAHNLDYFCNKNKINSQLQYMNDTYTPQCTLRNRKKLPRNYEYRHLGS